MSSSSTWTSNSSTNDSIRISISIHNRNSVDRGTSMTVSNKSTRPNYTDINSKISTPPTVKQFDRHSLPSSKLLSDDNSDTKCAQTSELWSLAHVLKICLVELCEVRPEDPIEYMARWLYHYADIDMYIHGKVSYIMNLFLTIRKMKRDQNGYGNRLKTVKYLITNQLKILDRLEPKLARRIKTSLQFDEILELAQEPSLQPTPIQIDLPDMSMIDYTRRLQKAQSTHVQRYLDGRSVEVVDKAVGTDDDIDIRISSSTDINNMVTGLIGMDYFFEPSTSLNLQTKKENIGIPWGRFSEGFRDMRSLTATSPRFSSPGVIDESLAGFSTYIKHKGARDYKPMRSSRSMDHKSVRSSRCNTQVGHWYLEMPSRRIVCSHPLLGKLAARRTPVTSKLDDICLGDPGRACQSLYDHEIYVRLYFDEPI